MIVCAVGQNTFRSRILMKNKQDVENSLLNNPLEDKMKKICSVIGRFGLNTIWLITVIFFCKIIFDFGNFTFQNYWKVNEESKAII